MRVAGFQLADLAIDRTPSPFSLPRASVSDCPTCSRELRSIELPEQVEPVPTGLDLFAVDGAPGRWVVRLDAAEAVGLAEWTLPILRAGGFGLLMPQSSVPLVVTDGYPRLVEGRCPTCDRSDVSGVMLLVVRWLAGAGVSRLDRTVWGDPIVLVGEKTAHSMTALRAPASIVMEAAYRADADDEIEALVEATRHGTFKPDVLSFAR